MSRNIAARVSVPFKNDKPAMNPSQKTASDGNDLGIARRDDTVAGFIIVIVKMGPELFNEIGRREEGRLRRHHDDNFAVLARRRNIDRRNEGARFAIFLMGNLSNENCRLSHF